MCSPCTAVPPPKPVDSATRQHITPDAAAGHHHPSATSTETLRRVWHRRALLAAAGSKPACTGGGDDTPHACLGHGISCLLYACSHDKPRGVTLRKRSPSLRGACTSPHAVVQITCRDAQRCSPPFNEPTHVPAHACTCCHPSDAKRKGGSGGADLRIDGHHARSSHRAWRSCPDA